MGGRSLRMRGLPRGPSAPHRVVTLMTPWWKMNMGVPGGFTAKGAEPRGVLAVNPEGDGGGEAQGLVWITKYPHLT